MARRFARVEPKKAAVWGGLAVLLIVGGVVSGPPGTAERGPEGTLAFSRFLQEMGVGVSRADEPPRPGRGTYLLMDDGRDEEGVDNLLDWVDEGGRLVVASPGDPLAEALGLELSEDITFLPISTQTFPACALFRGSEVGGVAISAVENRITKAPAEFEKCLPAAGGFFLVAGEYGEGEIFVLGGPSPFTNRLLRAGDNALFALRLFDGHGPVVLGPPIDTSGLRLPTSFWEAMPGAAQTVVIQICIALVVFAVVKGRRFGKPVTGQAISPLPSSGLASAVGELYRSAGAAGYAGKILRNAAVRRIARRMGVPAGTDRAAALEVAGQALGERGLDASILHDPDPQDDDELIVLAQELKKLEESVAST